MADQDIKHSPKGDIDVSSEKDVVEGVVVTVTKEEVHPT
jgi:hypothetical protein